MYDCFTNSIPVKVNTLGKDSWFALKVNTRSEPLAAKALAIRGFETFSPTYSERRQYTDRFKIIDVPVFSGYVLIRWDGKNKHLVLTSPAVQSFVCFGNQLATISNQVITDVQRMLACGASPIPYLKPGDKVRVATGLLSGVEGTYLRRGSGGQLIVSVDVLERSVALRIDEDQVQLLNKNCALAARHRDHAALV